LERHYACVPSSSTARRARGFLVAIATTVIVAGVVVARAWPAPTRRLSLDDAQRACATMAEHHGGKVSAYSAEVVATERSLDAQFHVGAGAFFGSVAKSGGLAECSFIGSDLPRCGLSRIDFSQVLATPDGSRFTLWCPKI
jgi:hypothetical protein